MITLNQNEKEFLRRIVRLADRTQDMFLGNLVDDHLVDIDVYLDYNRRIAEFRFDQNAFPVDANFPGMAREMSWTFMRYVKLLKYLENLNYLYLYKEAPPAPYFRYGRLIGGRPFIRSEIHDREVVELLIECSHRTIIVGQSLIDYVNNDFKTEEQIRHEENMDIARQNLKVAADSLSEAQKGLKISEDSLVESRKGLKISEESLEESRRGIEISMDALEDSRTNLTIARRALWLAIILGVVGIVGSAGEVYYAWVGAKQTDTKIDHEQFEALNSAARKIDEVLKRLDELEKTMSGKDTLITKVVNFPKP